MTRLQRALPAARRALTGPDAPTRLSVHYFLAGFGYIAMLSTLVLILGHKGVGTAATATLFTFFTAVNRLGKLPLAPWLDHVAPRWVMAGGCAIAATGIVVLAASRGMPAMAASLATCALGTSVNALAAKQLAAELVDGGEPRLAMFSRLSSAGNLAAAVSAPAAAWLLASRGPWALVTLVAGAYVGAAVFTTLRGPRSPQRDHSTLRAAASAPTGFAAWREVLGRPGMPAFFALNAAGWLLYYQFFSVLPLALGGTRGTSVLLGPLLTVNTLMVAVLQVRVSRFTDRHSNDELTHLALGLLCFGLGFATLAAGTGSVALVLFVVLVSVAEMLFVPAIDSGFVARLGPGPRATGFALLSLSTAVGESLGAMGGMTLFPSMERVAPGAYWVLLAFAAASLGGVALAVQRRSTRPVAAS